MGLKIFKFCVILQVANVAALQQFGQYSLH